MSTQLDEHTDEVLDTGEAEAAHIIKTEPWENAAGKVMEARIWGFALEALCGKVFVPEKDPTKLPLCQKCKDIYEVYRSVNDLSETPIQ